MARVLLGTAGGAILVFSRQGVGDLSATSTLVSTGVGLTFGASLCLAASNLTAKKALGSINQGSLTFWSMLIGALALAPFAFAEQQPILKADYSIWACMLYLALVCSVVAFFLWNHALAVGDPLTIASTMHIKTPVAVAVGCLINGENLTWTVLAGGLLIGVGVWVAQQQATPKAAQLPRMAA